MLEQLNKLDTDLDVVFADVKRWRVFYAACDLELLNPVESVLIDKTMEKIERDPSFKCDNSRRQNFGYDKRIEFSIKFEGSSQEVSILEKLLGDTVFSGSPNSI